MTTPLKRLMLIDDSDADNYFHKIVIEEAAVAESIETYTYAEDALNRLRTVSISELPHLILLDINMPRMSGWDFIDRYAELEIARRTGVVVAMLTTSLNPDDARRSAETRSVTRFINKPLTTQMLHDILATTA